LATGTETDDHSVIPPPILRIPLADRAGLRGSSSQPTAGDQHQWSQGDRQHRDDDEHRLHASELELVVPRHLNDYEGEFTDLGHQKSGTDPNPVGQGETTGSDPNDHGLADDDRRQSQRNQYRLVQDHRDIEQHADADEEQAAQGIPERRDFRRRLMVVPGLRQNQADQKRAER
jgi:hypothetical protein